MIRNLAKLTLIVVATSLLFGCTTANKAFRQSTYNANNTKYRINRQNKLADTQEPDAIIKSGYYVDANPIVMSNNPAWLRNRITLEGNNLPLSFLIKQVLRNSNTTVSYRPSVRTSKAITLNYRGTIKGALDAIAQKTNYAYDIDGNEITWSNFVTKTFNISFMPGSSDYMVGQSAGNSATNSSDTDISTMKGNLDDEQYSNLKGTLSVWKDLANTLKDLKSKDGKIYVSESTTSVTVRDHPSNVQSMSEYIKQLNREMSRQVQLKVRVLQVELDRSHQYGVDWSVVQKWFGMHFSLSADVMNTIDTSTTAATASPVQLILGRVGGSNAILHAIGEQGKVRVITEPTTVTMNNQVAEIRISRDTSYLKKLEQSVGVNSGSSNVVSTSLEPGIVTDGFALYVLPKIKNQNIYLQISSSTSTLEKIDTINSSGQLNHATSAAGTTIQIPTLAEKRFNMKSMLRNGSTLVIAGFKQLSDRTKQTSVFGSTKLGGRGSSQDNIETVILITPTIIENK